ncbi:MAG: TIGR00282 family metallophosphoesterase [Terriglobales bacterium]
MKILFVGDIFASPGRALLRAHLSELVARHQVDLVVVNGENAAGGFGITGALAEEMLALGADVVTTGNHVWDRKEIQDYLRSGTNAARVLRPANFPPTLPGQGLYQGVTRGGEPYAVLNLQGRVYMTPLDCPFRKADELLATLPATCRTIFVDFHAEATSEKQAMGWYLDGRVTAVIGTHTHVPTADERILPHGTAFQTDVGMTGAYAGIIGCRQDEVLSRFLTGVHTRLEPAEGDACLNGVLIEAQDGKAVSIARCRERSTVDG